MPVDRNKKQPSRVRRRTEHLDSDEPFSVVSKNVKLAAIVSATVQANPAWTGSKSPLGFQVRRFVGRGGHEFVILADRCRGPAFYPTVFMTCCYDKARKSPNTREMVLRSVGMARAWSEARGRDLDWDLRHGPFLSLADAEALADHLMLSVEAQVLANNLAAAMRQAGGRVLKLEKHRPNPKVLASVPGGLQSGSAFARIKWVAYYVEWHLMQRVGNAERSSANDIGLRDIGPPIVARLRERGRGDGSRWIENEALEGVSQEVIDLVSAALRPGDSQNPFTPGFVQVRNDLLWHLYVSTGGRRAEVQSVLVKDVSFSQRRMYISKSKTRTRTVSISSAAADRFDSFIEHYWAKLPRAARKRGLLFTGATGRPLSVRAINRIFVAIRTRVPGCPDFLTPHTTRRTFSDSFGEMIDRTPPEKRPPLEEEMRMHNLLQGWSPTSSMSAHYASRHIRRKTDELAENLANTIDREEPSATSD